MRSLLAALLFVALCPASAHALAFPWQPLPTDYLRFMAGAVDDFEHGLRYAGEIGMLFDLGRDSGNTALGPVGGVSVNDDVRRLSIGLHVENGLRGGPEFVHLRVGDEGHYGGALALGLEIPLLRYMAAGVGGRLGGTERGFFGELGFTFVIRLPAGPRAARQVARLWPYPKCGSDLSCEFRGERCIEGMCQQCGEDAHCAPEHVCAGNRCQWPQTPRPE